MQFDMPPLLANSIEATSRHESRGVVQFYAFELGILDSDNVDNMDYCFLSRVHGRK
jgi:hypothetical protein